MKTALRVELVLLGTLPEDRETMRARIEAATDDEFSKIQSEVFAAWKKRAKEYSADKPAWPTDGPDWGDGHVSDHSDNGCNANWYTWNYATCNHKSRRQRAYEALRPDKRTYCDESWRRLQRMTGPEVDALLAELGVA